ncbi:MAG TPA: amino acid ABC transporter ATP-binding protein [Solirubrobacterales bacterium]
MADNLINPQSSIARQADGSTTNLLELTKLEKRFGDHIVLDEVSTSLKPREVVALIGPSGAGKSTLLRCINYLETPTAGSIALEGQPFTHVDPDGSGHRPSRAEQALLRRKVGMVFQSFNLFPHLTAIQNVTLGQVHTLGRSKSEAQERSRSLLTRVGLGDKLDAYPTRMSGGQQQRVAIARALALDPILMLFDEPTSAIDPELRVEVLAVMKDLAENGMTMMIATHEMHFAEDVADRILFLADGKILEEGPPKKVLREPRHERTQKFLGAVMDR